MFKKNKKSTIATLRAKSDSIFNVFTQTQTDLAHVNLQIAEETAAREEEIKQLQAEVDELNSIQSKNTKLSNKIEQFLNS